MDADLTRALIRRLAIAALDDDRGLNELAYAFLRQLLEDYDSNDIIDRVEATDGHFYISEDSAMDLRIIVGWNGDMQNNGRKNNG